jgi:hypothetical protein
MAKSIGGGGNNLFNFVDRNMSNKMFAIGGPIGLGLLAGATVYAHSRDRHSVDASIVNGTLTALAVGGLAYGALRGRSGIKRVLQNSSMWMASRMFNMKG